MPGWDSGTPGELHPREGQLGQHCRRRGQRSSLVPGEPLEQAQRESRSWEQPRLAGSGEPRGPQLSVRAGCHRGGWGWSVWDAVLVGPSFLPLRPEPVGRWVA